MPNLKDYYTHTQAAQILGKTSYYALLQARRKVSIFSYGNKYLYHRAELDTYAYNLAGKDRAEITRINSISFRIEEIDLDLDVYISRSDALQLWPHTAEWLYRNTTIRNPKSGRINAVQVGQYIFFNKEDIVNFSAWEK